MAHTESQLNKIRENADIQELIVSGYIHDIQRSLDLQQLIIPNEIYVMCYYFYWNTILIFIHKNNFSNNWSEFGILDTVNKTVSRIGLNKLKRSSFVTSFCFIPNVSNHLNTKLPKNYNHNTVYNAIFGFIKKSDHDSDGVYYYGYNNINITFYASLLLFDQNYMFYQNDYSDNYHQNKFEYEIKSAQLKHMPISPPKQVLFCGNNGIIFENHCKLYQLKLTEVILRNKQKLKFERLNTTYASPKKRFNSDGLQLMKLSETNQLFAIESTISSEFFVGPKIKCGIFNFGANEWTFTKNYSFNPDNMHNSFYCTTYYDKIKNRIYQTNSIDCTAFYDLKKDKWNALFEYKSNIFNFTQQQLWIDQYQPNILYVLYADSTDVHSYCYFDAPQKIVHKYCDLRERKRKWKKCEKMKTDYFQTNSFVAFGYSLFSP